jgi:hypothetical protein
MTPPTPIARRFIPPWSVNANNRVARVGHARLPARLPALLVISVSTYRPPKKYVVAAVECAKTPLAAAIGAAATAAVG